MALTSCQKLTSVSVNVTSIKVIKFEEQDHNGNVWDVIATGTMTRPDIFVRVASNGDAMKESETITDAAQGEYMFDNFNLNIPLDDYSKSFELQLLDEDPFEDVLMGDLTFSVDEDFTSLGKVILENDKVGFELTLEWVKE